MLICLIATGCSKPKPAFERIRAGMSEDQVINLIGKPTTRAMQGGILYLEYKSYDYNPLIDWGPKNHDVFFVRLIDNKVESFGRKGDFDSTKNPTQEIKIEKSVTDKNAFDLKAELEKLEKLKKDGTLNEAEYQELRKKLIDKAGK